MSKKKHTIVKINQVPTTPEEVEEEMFEQEDAEPTAPKVEVEIVKPKPIGGSFESRIADLKANGSDIQKTVIATMEKYVDEMAPGKPISYEAGAKMQYALWKMIENVLLRLPREEFNPPWNLILLYFQKYGGMNDVLGPRYVFRFSSSWNYGEVSLRNFEDTINLLHVTADPNKRTRALRTEIDLRLTFGDPYPQEASQRLSAFYGV